MSLPTLDFWPVILETYESVRASYAAWRADPRAVVVHTPHTLHICELIDTLGILSDASRSFIHTYGDILSHAFDPAQSVFIHLDLQPGNLLRVSDADDLMLIDYEYAGWGPRAADIANHFSEWMGDYGSATPHVVHAERYPSRDAQRHFLTAYLGAEVAPELLARMLDEIDFFSLASDIKWVFWALLQWTSRRDASDASFYIGFAVHRWTRCLHVKERLMAPFLDRPLSHADFPLSNR
jgi:Ser/Thr protein kinase RdoA (MazF antagonist)